MTTARTSSAREAVRKVALLHRVGDNVPPVSTAQIVFAIALGTIAVLILFFSFYVVSTTVWGDRWVRRGKK